MIQSVSSVVTPIWHQIPLFCGLDEKEAQHLESIFTPQAFADGAEIVSQGGNEQRLWILVKGKCDVVRTLPGSTPNAGAKDVLLATLEPFTCFGEMSFFDAAAHSASVRARGVVTLLTTTRGSFDVFAQSYPHSGYRIGLNVIASLADRLRRMDGWVVELEADKPTKRNNDWDRLRQKLMDNWTL